MDYEAVKTEVGGYFDWFQGAISGLSKLIEDFTKMLQAFVESWKKRFTFAKYTGTEA